MRRVIHFFGTVVVLKLLSRGNLRFFHSKVFYSVQFAFVFLLRRKVLRFSCPLRRESIQKLEDLYKMVL